MKLEEVLKALGADRVIWVDDRFNEKKPSDLADLLLGSPDIATKCGNPQIAKLVESAEFDPDGARGELIQLLVDMKDEEKKKLTASFFQHETEDTHMATPELESEVVETACKLLSINAGDRWTFKDAMKKVEACAKDDEAISYIIDLNESGGNDKEGLEVLKALRQYSSKGTAFLLTHAADIKDEVAKEKELQADLNADPKNDGIPLCVISKQRLVEATDDDGIAEALRVAMKRAGLRKSVHEVLQTMKRDVALALEDAAKSLLEIPPEQLDEFVIERGIQEGVSELHVVERAITAQVSQTVRERFATDPGVLKSIERLRALRAVTLGSGGNYQVHANLDDFRRMEVFESSALINKSYTPIACGDIFECDELEGSGRRRFLLLGQPCDISLRGTKDRDQEFAMLVPLKVREGAGAGGEDKIKLRPLQFKLAGVQWACDFRDATAARLSILDLASFREDGRVRYDEGQSSGIPLLAALRKVVEERVTAAKEAFAKDAAGGMALQLCFRSSNPFNGICEGKLAKKETKSVGGASLPLPRRVTWGLKRTGRIRMPYAAALLRDYLAVQGRDAFDLDFTKDSSMPAATCAPAAAVCG